MRRPLLFILAHLTLIAAVGSVTVGCNLSDSDVEEEFNQVDPTPDAESSGDADVGVNHMNADTNGADLDVGDRDSDDPDAAEPDTGDPDSGDPDAGEPDTDDPDSGAPDTGEPDADAPDAGDPDCEPGELDNEPGDATPFMWSDVVVDGEGEESVATNWVGKAAWSDRTDVRDTVASQIADGVIPYLFFFHWGDGPGTTMGQFPNASQDEIDDWIDFAEHIADGIGDGQAYVVLEPEWDSNPEGANSSKFKAPLMEIIDYFRQEAPNAVLVNGPGLWKEDSVYEDFADAASQMDLQGFLHHVVSDDPFCTYREAGAYAGTHYEGGAPFSHHVQIADNVETQAERIQNLFDADEVILTDMAVTRCDWGADGQEEILENLVDALPDLYDTHGLRGVAIRDGGPAPEFRYMGHENEGQFGYSGHPAESHVNQAPQTMNDHLSALSDEGEDSGIDECITGPIYEPNVWMSEEVNNWWIEVYPDDGADDVESVEVLLPGQGILELEQQDWGSFAASPDEETPPGTQIHLVARDGPMSAGSDPFGFQQQDPQFSPGWPADFHLSENINECWIEVDVDDAISVEVSIDGEGFVELPEQDWGHFADSICTDEGTDVLLRAQRNDGAISYSTVYPWLEDNG